MLMERDPHPTWISIHSRRLPFSFRLDRRIIPVALAILIFTAVVLVISISYGEYKIAPLDVLQTLFRLNTAHPDYANLALVVHTFRLPRIVLAFLVGMALATSGALMQGITRNPLADPYLIGVSGGAGLAAVILIVWLKTVPTGVLPVAAFGGGAAAAALIYVLAWKRGGAMIGGGSSPIRLILIGIGIESAVTALTTTLIVFSNVDDVQQAYIWLTGSVYGRNWEHVYALGLPLLILFPAALLMARRLNLHNLGDDAAAGLGLPVERSRLLLLIVSVGLAAFAVAVSGTIGFVGLVAPHIARRLVGPAHEGMLMISALIGGALVVTADLIGRWALAPSELPVGIVTAMLGAPYFAYLLYRSRNR